MINKISKIIFLFIFSFIISFGVYTLCRFIAEKYLFDRFFYRKSISHGYVLKDKLLSDYGNRAKDLIAIKEKAQNIFESNNKQVFKVAIIGDSYVWGQGIRNNQRLKSILEQKLNKIRPTKIIAIGQLGNSTLDYLKYYEDIQHITKTDLNIFVIVGNDAFINFHQEYRGVVEKCQNLFPHIKPVCEIYGDLNSKGYNLANPTQEILDIITKAHGDSWINPINQCVVNTSSLLLPTEKSIYFIPDNYTTDNSYDTYINFFKKTNKFIISIENSKNLKKYKKYWNDPYKYFTVSPLEGHPSALANQAYADILYNEITTNPRWNFTKSE